jgi:hypothetical protein
LPRFFARQISGTLTWFGTGKLAKLVLRQDSRRAHELPRKVRIPDIQRAKKKHAEFREAPTFSIGSN